MKNSGFTLRKRALSLKYAFHGIFLLISREHNAWIHCFAAVCVITAGILSDYHLWNGLSSVYVSNWFFRHRAVNSAIEALADRVSPAYDEAIKRTTEFWRQELFCFWLSRLLLLD